MSRYIEQAVDALYSQINDDLPGKLDDVESDSGLSAGDLPNPVAVLKYQAPGDMRTPLVQVFDLGMSPYGEDGQRHGVYTVPCRVTLAVGSDANVAAGEVKTRRYVDALMRSVLGDETLGGSALQCWFTGAQASIELNESTPTRHVYDFDFEVTVQSVAGG